MSINAVRRALVLAVVLSSVVGCGRVERFLAEQPGPVIAGIEMGPRRECRNDDLPTCAEFITIAESGLDDAGRDPADVVGVTLFSQPVHHTTSGQTTYVVFEFTDGDSVVVDVYCGVGGCHTTDNSG